MARATCRRTRKPDVPIGYREHRRRESPRGGSAMQPMTRRTFLRQGGLTAGSFMVAPLLGLASTEAAAAPATVTRLNNAHWGLFTAEVVGGRVVRTIPFSKDPHPNPMIRRGFYRDRSRSDTAGRGAEPFVRVSWDEALGIVAGELQRVKTQYGNRAIYDGSYGWQSPGKFHSATAAMQRLLVLLGGYVYHVNSYSAPTLPVISPHVVGDSAPRASAWPTIIRNS